MKFNVFPIGKESISSWLQYVCRRGALFFVDFPRDVETQENDGSEKAQKKQLDRNSRAENCGEVDGYLQGNRP